MIILPSLTLRMSGKPFSNVRGQAAVRIALSMRAECTLLDWVSINSRLCASRLGGFFTCRLHLVEASLFVRRIFVHAN